VSGQLCGQPQRSLSTRLVAVGSGRVSLYLGGLAHAEMGERASKGRTRLICGDWKFQSSKMSCVSW